MENKFEKMDEWMMKASREARERKIPQKELDAFHEGVMKKILTPQTRGWGMPYAGFLFAAALSGAVLFGAVFYLHHVRVVPEETPVKADVKLVTEPLVPAPFIKEAVKAETVAAQIVPQAPAPVLVPKEIPGAVAVMFVKEEDLLEEIEALKELGVWTEEDEEEAGIPVEAAFAELESYMGDNQPSVALPAAARSGA